MNLEIHGMNTLNIKRKLLTENYLLAHEFVTHYLNEVCKNKDKDDIANVVIMVVADFIDKAMVDLKPLLKNKISVIDSNIVFLSIAKSMNAMSSSLQEMLLGKECKQ